MKSVKSIFKIGKGPSSSHTMGPFKAVTNYIENHPEAKSLHVTLYGSLAATGKGHLTDKAIEEAAANAGLDVVIAWEPKENLPEHPNGMVVASVGEDNSLTDSWTYYSVGGGDIKCMDIELADEDGEEVYEMTTMKEILDWCNKNGKAFWEFVQENEEKTKGFWEHIELVWKTMQKAVERGIDEEGALPGPLNIRRKAGSYYIKADGYGDVQRARGLIFAYALAVSEENACGGKIVTAPTCGSCGVLPGVLYHLKKVYGFSDQRIIRALATAGIIGNIVKHNASISGAEVGCQGEVGVACAMAAGAITQLMGGSPSQIEYAAEMGLEHHLGLTCDPVCGMVQIPCIERNAYAAARAMDASIYSLYTDGRHRVSFDQVVRVMKETGKDLPSLYKETSEGGLAKHLE
ncbi:MAG: L-serine ammonia-lyase [Bacteroidales bacterium]|nr:L-serine ammonia-lyase [Bacteroidales bacterium]